MESDTEKDTDGELCLYNAVACEYVQRVYSLGQRFTTKAFDVTSVRMLVCFMCIYLWLGPGSKGAL